MKTQPRLRPVEPYSGEIQTDEAIAHEHSHIIACINHFFGISAGTLQAIETMPHAPAFKQAGKFRTGSDPSILQSTGILTEQERDMVRLIGQGRSNKDIADHLCISAVTIRHHLTSIFDKLGVTTRPKLLVRAHQNGLVESPVPA
jgi:DNA-binding CsgD family transcriptional regulator